MSLPFLKLPIGTQADVAQPRKLQVRSTLTAVCLPYDSHEFAAKRFGMTTSKWKTTSDSKLVDEKMPFLQMVNAFHFAFKYPSDYQLEIADLRDFKKCDKTMLMERSFLCGLVSATMTVAESALEHNFQGIPDSQLEERWYEFIEHGHYIRKDLSGKTIVVIGDTHGSMHSLTDIFLDLQADIFDASTGKLLPNVHVVCLGDMLDRSPYTLETLALMLKLYVDNSKNVTLLLGNHEYDNRLWKKSNGTSYEIKKEYGNLCFDKDDMENLIYYTLRLFPSSLIAKTTLGTVQFNHGGFETPLTPANRAKLASFVAFQPGFESVLQCFDKSVSSPLQWSDLAIEATEEEKTKSLKSGRTLNTASELKGYLTDFGIRMLIRGHADLANLSLVYPPGVEPSSQLQEQDAGSVQPLGMKWKIGSKSYVDSRKTIPKSNTFVRKANTIFKQAPYDMWTLVFGRASGRVVKTLASPDDASSQSLLAVTTSTCVFSKPMPPIMTMSSYLVLQ